MAEDDTKSGMTGAERHVYGPRGIAALLPDVTRPAFKKHNPGSAQILDDWEVIVGPKVA